MEVRDLGLIVMENCQELGGRVDQKIQELRNTRKSFIIPIEEVRFKDGEAKVVIEESIRGKDLYILSDTHNYSITYPMYDFVNHKSPDDHFMDLKRTILATMGHAERLNVVMPLLYASRQHRRKRRESLDCAWSLQELAHLGVSEIITFDAHDPNVQNAIPMLPFDNFYTTNDMLKEFLSREDFKREDTMVINPDSGASDRARYVADILGTEVGGYQKRRDHFHVENGQNPIVSHEYNGKDVLGKTIIIVDDMLASGTSMLDAARDLKERGASKIYFFVTFALFTSLTKEIEEAYADKIFERIYATNLNYVPKSILEKEWFCSVDISEYLAKIIDTLNQNRSISDLIHDNSALQLVRKKNE